MSGRGRACVTVTPAAPKQLSFHSSILSFKFCTTTLLCLNVFLLLLRSHVLFVCLVYFNMMVAHRSSCLLVFLSCFLLSFLFLCCSNFSDQSCVSSEGPSLWQRSRHRSVSCRPASSRQHGGQSSPAVRRGLQGGSSQQHALQKKMRGWVGQRKERKEEKRFKLKAGVFSSFS